MVTHVDTYQYRDCGPRVWLNYENHMIDIAMPYCRSAILFVLYKKKSFSMRLCQNCDLGQQNTAL